MLRRFPALCLVVLCQSAFAQNPSIFGDASGQLIMRGKVTMEDGKVPPERVSILRLCPSVAATVEALTNKRGEFMWRVGESNDAVIGRRRTGRVGGPVQCWLAASLRGLQSNRIDIQDPALYRRVDLPTLVLKAPPSGAAASEEAPALSRPGAKAWAEGLKELSAARWPEAERLMRDVTRTDPKFGPAWIALGGSCQSQQKNSEARAAFQRAVAVDPSSLLARVQLLRVEMASRLWDDASKTAASLIQVDTARRHPEAYVQHAIARYMLRDADGAHASLTMALRLDPGHKFPQSEYFMGAVLAAKGDREGAVAHFRSYLEFAPAAPNTEFVKQQIEKLSRPEAAASVATMAPAPDSMLTQPVEPVMTTRGEAWVPGGRKALAAIVRLKTVPSSEQFFLEYCRAIATQNSRLTVNPIPGFMGELHAYMDAVTELSALGERRDGSTRITLSLDGEASQRKTGRILKLLGWQIARDGDAITLDPGDDAADGPRHKILPAFEIDELAMRRELEAGKSFQFDIPTEDATLIGGPAWGALLQGFSSLPGGMAEAFLRQPRFAKTYAGLGAMGNETALALIGVAGLRTLDTESAEALRLFGGSFRIADRAAVVPGGAAAEAVWKKLAGASPRDPAKFFAAVLKVDGGRLAAFYSALAEADEPHQKLFTRTETAARRFYEWYRDSEELRGGVGVPARTWRPQVFQSLPLDASGAVRFPGGRQAWWSGSAAAPDDEVLLHGKSRAGRPVDLEALLAAAKLEQDRGAPLDPSSAALFARNFLEWRSLLPYFAALPAMGAAGFQALDAFAKSAAAASPAAQNTLLGEWHSLVKLIVLGRQAGALDDAAAARAFTRACSALSGRDHSTKAVEILREIAGGGRNPDEAVASHLLRLSGPRREAFDRVRRLQNAPRLDTLGASPAANRTAAALACLVYGTLLDPDGLLVGEDRRLLSKHAFSLRTGLFQPAALVKSSVAPGSHLAGGFADFEEVARSLARGGAGAPPPDETADTATTPEIDGPSDSPTAAIFRASGRLVEVHAIVTDPRDNYVDNLNAGRFAILDGGHAVNISAFESRGAAVSCVLLLDTTQSMEAALPALKNAAVKLIGALRPIDTVAVYSLTGGITELQPFTTDKAAATRAVWGAELGGMTGLYDGLVRVTRDLSSRTGKKMIVVFTDGEDNDSSLSAETAVLRAKRAGVPIYTIAQGYATRSRALLKELGDVAQATGGLAFTIQSATEIRNIFDRVLQDLFHGYLLGFQPPSAEDRAWRSIQVLLHGQAGLKIRARGGYYPE